MNKLDELDRLEKANRHATYGGKGFEFESLLLNNARALIDVARAAYDIKRREEIGGYGFEGIPDLLKALEKLK